MLSVILFQPEIPPNTGNVIRLCANTGTALHLVEPLGFTLDDRQLKRAGLDYREWADVKVHASLGDAWAASASRRLIVFTTKAERSYAAMAFASGDALLFGPESRGLPARVIESVDVSQRLRIPMRAGSRSLNLSNAVAIGVYEAWRQLGFPGGTPR